MPANRFYHPGPLEQGEILSLTETEHHHLQTVMRGKQGDKIEVIDGKGSLAIAEILAFGKRETSLLLQDVTTHPPSQFNIHLAQALLRSQKLDLLIEKGTELGVTEFLLFPAARSERDKFPKEERLHSLLISALKQSGRLFLPKITFLPKFSELRNLPSPFFGDLSPDAPKLSQAIKKGDHFTFITGPEAGFTDHELEELRSFAKGVNLNDATLRAETASIAAVAIAKEYYL